MLFASGCISRNMTKWHCNATSCNKTLQKLHDLSFSGRMHVVWRVAHTVDITWHYCRHSLCTELRNILCTWLWKVFSALPQLLCLPMSRSCLTIFAKTNSQLAIRYRKKKPKFFGLAYLRLFGIFFKAYVIWSRYDYLINFDLTNHLNH